MDKEEEKKLISQFRTLNSRLYQLEITEGQKDLLIMALVHFDSEVEDLPDEIYNNLRYQLDNATFLGDSA